MKPGLDETVPGRRRPHRLQRRAVLSGALWLGAGAGTASLLAGCGDDSGSAPSATEYPLATPDNPVELPLFEDNPAIDDGLSPEDSGVLRVLNYPDYIAPGVKKDFGEKYDVEVQVTPVSNIDEMLQKLSAPGAEFDLVFPNPRVMSRMVYGKLLQPLNRTYLPNLSNAWPEYQDPWYDQGARYSVPYTVYTTGVGYRADRVDNPEAGYQLIWDAQYKGKVGVIDDANESLAMAMLAFDIGGGDINTDNQEYINAARDKLIELIDLVGVKIGITQYETIPNGRFTVHQAWSGDMIAARFYLPEDETTDVLGYWRPEDKSQVVVGIDNIAVPKSAPSPVLAHAFLNDILDNDVSEKNFNWNGYQPPLTKLDADYLVQQGYISANLTTALVVPDDFTSGKSFHEQTPAVDNMWLAAFQEFQSGGV